MQWTKTAPSEPGLYWVRTFNDGTTVVQLHNYGVSFLGSDMDAKADAPDLLEWAGPITPPE